MPSTLRRLLAAAAGSIAALATLTGCGVTFVVGSATPASGQVGTVQAQDFPVVGATDDEVDQLARNALADLNTYWQEQFPATFGRDFTPLSGGYYSVDPANIDPAQYPGGQIGCGEPPDAVQDNAFYCPASTDYPNGDAIQYDRAFLRDLAFGTGNEAGYGRFIPALVMAHEFGHAVQARVGYPFEASIAIETQADCFAGAWTSWVADGKAPHTTIRTPELDDVLRGYSLLRDPVGTSLNETAAHGSLFDRVSAFQQGFDAGTAACRDDFGPDRPYTQREFDPRDPSDAANNGNSSYPDTQRLMAQALPSFWTSAFTGLGKQFQSPRIEAFSHTAPACGGKQPDTDLVFCAADDTVGYDETDLTKPLYADPGGGDYAVLTAVAIPYALAAREQLGLSTDDEGAIRSAVCLAGAFTSAILQGTVRGISISPGDVDESVQFLLGYSDDPHVLGDVGLSGFQLVDVFRGGVFEGLTPCGVGA